MLALFRHPACALHSNWPGHPEHAGRLAAVESRLDRDLVAPGAAVWLEAPAAAGDDLKLVHDAAYLDSLVRLDRVGGGVLDPDTAMGPGSLAAASRAAGAVVHAASRALAGEGPAFCAVRPPGHHATPSRAMGFCLLSNAAIAARAALSRLGADRVLVVDWDVHHGNGTADAVRAEQRIRYVSIHLWPWYPGTGAAEDVGAGNLFHVPRPAGLPRGTYTTDLLAAVDRALVRFPPSLVIVSAGFDSLRGDPLGGFTWEPEDYATITLALRARMPEVPMVSVLEGGYDPARVAEAAALHAAALAA